jgi:hypothetical protein
MSTIAAVECKGHDLLLRRQSGPLEPLSSTEADRKGSAKGENWASRGTETSVRRLKAKSNGTVSGCDESVKASENGSAWSARSPSWERKRKEGGGAAVILDLLSAGRSAVQQDSERLYGRE